MRKDQDVVVKFSGIFKPLNVTKEIKAAQGMLDKIVPGKVKVSAEYDSERGCYILVGSYLAYYDYAPKGGACTWTESMDRFYTDCKLFVSFFKQRAKFMNASIEEQIAFDGHPATY